MEDVSQGKECNFTVSAIRYFSSFLSPRHAQGSIKQWMPKGRTKKVDGGSALTLSRSGTARDLAKALSTLGILHVTPGSHLPLSLLVCKQR